MVVESERRKRKIGNTGKGGKEEERKAKVKERKWETCEAGRK